MRTSFTPAFISSHRGCYERVEVENLSFINQSEVSIKTILDSEIPLKDKFWFVSKNCDLTFKEKQILAYNCAKMVLPIYEAKYPNDSRVRDCVDATGKFLNGEITIEELKEKKAAANAAADDDAAAAYTARAAAYDAAAYTARAAAYDAAAYDAAAYAAADAAAADAAAAAYNAADAAGGERTEYNYTEQLLQILKDFFKCQ